MTSDSEESRWRVNPRCQLHWRHWEEDYIVYNAASGQTHCLNELAAAILQDLESASRSTQDVADGLHGHYDLDLDDEMIDAIQETLTDLDSLGLISPA